MFVDSHKVQQRILKPLDVKLVENKALTACEVTPQGLISINEGNTTKEKPGGLLPENFSSSSRICEQLGLVRFQICNEWGYSSHFQVFCNEYRPTEWLLGLYLGVTTKGLYEKITEDCVFLCPLWLSKVLCFSFFLI